MDGEGEGHHDHFEFSPLLIGLLGILAGSTMVAVYHCLSAGFRYRRGIQNLQSNTQHDRPMRATTARIFRRGPVVKYTKGGEEGVCAVCLSEFAEGEDVRVLSECTHSFHVACIDMWLHSHSNCPLCRAETGQSASHLALSMPESGGALPQQQAHNTTTVPPDNIGASMIVHYNL